MPGRAFECIPVNTREAKPRRRGVTEVRGPYYTPVGQRYLTDLLETMGDHIDSLKFAGGSFVLMPEVKLRELIEMGPPPWRPGVHRGIYRARVGPRATGRRRLH